MNKCPHCGELYSERNQLIPTHQYPKRSGRLCPGSGQTPRNAESDRRPLWKDEAQLHGVYIDTETNPRLTTMDIPHRVVQHAGSTFFIGRYPEGDYCIHEWSSYNQQGYGNSDVTFLLEDGTFRTVHGPFSCAGVFDHGVAAKIAYVTGIADIAVKASRESHQRRRIDDPAGDSCRASGQCGRRRRRWNPIR